MAGLNAPIFPNITTEYLNRKGKVAMAENWDRPKQWQTKYA
ncbi:hypothetical protein Plhal304r1_c010g0041051 [Plasmopara halstedii]